MRKHRNPPQRLSKLPSPDNFDPELSELLGEARTLAAHDAAAPDVAHDGAPMLALDAGGAP